MPLVIMGSFLPLGGLLRIPGSAGSVANVVDAWTSLITSIRIICRGVSGAASPMKIEKKTVRRILILLGM